MEMLEVPAVSTRVRILLRNRASLAHIASVKRILAGITEAGSAARFYQELLVRRAKVMDGSGGLGLARICAEADMDVTCNVEGDVIAIDATTPIGRGDSSCSKS
jgi:hypothetical protein